MKISKPLNKQSREKQSNKSRTTFNAKMFANYSLKTKRLPVITLMTIYLDASFHSKLYQFQGISHLFAEIIQHQIMFYTTKWDIKIFQLLLMLWDIQDIL